MAAAWNRRGLGGGIEFVEVAEVALDLGEAGEEGVVGFREALDDGRGELDERRELERRCSGRGRVLPRRGGVGSVDLGDLMAEEIDLALQEASEAERAA